MDESKDVQHDGQKRVSSFNTFNTQSSPFRTLSRNLILVVIFILMSMPLFTTFNEILTKVAESTGVYSLFTQMIVPFQTRAVSLVMVPLGMKVAPTKTHVYVTDQFGKTTGIFFSWNCLGWQSGILLFFTLAIGLRGRYHLSQRIETIALGLSGTFLINILRISVVTIIAYYFGQLPATIVHDYGGTLFTVLWFFLYWWLAYEYILTI